MTPLTFLFSFTDRTDKPLVRQICEGDYCFPTSKWNDISNSAIDLVKRLMKVNPKERLSADQVNNHDIAFFQKQGFRKCKEAVVTGFSPWRIDGGISPLLFCLPSNNIEWINQFLFRNFIHLLYKNKQTRVGNLGLLKPR